MAFESPHILLCRLNCDGTNGSTIPGGTYYPTKISLRLKHRGGASAALVKPCLWRVNTSSGAITLLEEGASFNVPTSQTTYATYETPLENASALAATTATEILAVGFVYDIDDVIVAGKSGLSSTFTNYAEIASPASYSSFLTGDLSAIADTPLMWVDIDTSPLSGGNVTGTLSETEDDDTVAAAGTVSGGDGVFWSAQYLQEGMSNLRNVIGVIR